VDLIGNIFAGKLDHPHGMPTPKLNVKPVFNFPSNIQQTFANAWKARTSSANDSDTTSTTISTSTSKNDDWKLDLHSPTASSDEESPVEDAARSPSPTDSRKMRTDTHPPAQSPMAKKHKTPDATSTSKGKPPSPVYITNNITNIYKIVQSSDDDEDGEERPRKKKKVAKNLFPVSVPSAPVVAPKPVTKPPSKPLPPKAVGNPKVNPIDLTGDDDDDGLKNEYDDDDSMHPRDKYDDDDDDDFVRPKAVVKRTSTK